MSTGNLPSSNNGGGGGGPCGACKFLRRKCVAECIFAPYFVSEQGVSHFAAVHKVFGASNVTKLLLHIPVNKRRDAVITICYEAQARLRDPVYGCVAQIVTLQQQVANLQAELSYFQAHLATLEAVAPPPPPPPPLPPAGLSITDLPTVTRIPTAYDLSSLFDPTLQPSSWTMQQMQFSGGTTIAPPVNLPPPQGGGGSGDGSVDQELGRYVNVPCSSGIPLSPHGSRRGDEIV
ncbi:hypothetical protein L6452_20278 [Arctium lappa]|uniref:Uncharacterized protein n=1 Tax=Arctium lappa TaxID=4217 RepID=A0ACB9BC85_ARCLA|nr:hypothetical protein L6452_20278 [Arctium lappa]